VTHLVPQDRLEQNLGIIGVRVVVPREAAIERLGILVPQFAVVPNDIAVRLWVEAR
jgi:hypothetical protein